MRLVGAEIAKMHKADVIHGDLTTSNIMLRRPSAPAQAPQIVCLLFAAMTSPGSYVL